MLNNDTAIVEALRASLKEQRPAALLQTRVAHFAFDRRSISFLSELPIEDLVPLLEVWCREQRSQMNMVQIPKQSYLF